MKRILIVDDEFMVRKAIRKLLNWEEYGFEDPTEAFDIGSALEILRRQPIDLLFTDIKMPGGSGIELLKQMGAEQLQIPFVYVITAFDDFDFARQAFRFGVKDFIIKTEISRDLLAAIAQNVNPPSQSAGTANQKVCKVLDYIEEHLKGEVSLSAAAEEVRLSAAHLSKLFAQEMGVPFSQYVSVRRIDRACKLLRETDEYVYTIAGQVGYPNFNYFNKVFKQILGITPNDYRNSKTK